MNETIEHLEDPYSQLQILPNTIAVIKSNRPPVSSKREAERINREINMYPLKQNIEYEPRNRRERRKNSIKNGNLGSNPQLKANINASNEHILNVRSQIENFDSVHYWVQ